MDDRFDITGTLNAAREAQANQFQQMADDIEETNCVREEQRVAAVTREERMADALAALQARAAEEHREAEQREAVAAKRHRDAMRVAWIGAGSGLAAAVLSAVAIVVTILVT